MGVKNALGTFFDELIKGYASTDDGLPIAPVRGDINHIIYVGKPDVEGWCKWRPIEKSKYYNFKEIEGEFGIKINDDIKEYFNSYWFLQVRATFKSNKITLDAITPEEELERLKRILMGYKDEHGGELKNIPIGTEMKRGYLIVVENLTGVVKFEDFDKKTIRKIAANIEEFILDLNPIII